ncbi:SusC/RagA family TonB-linked outer membrane protein [Paradesertivirga mongoliensis]|uniref:SusC/RagA family TonB-linked outer membrane protein n=1 Tax=Paradesertivirga mongoliensis TaxID=2100740 RepID=A0ABW4ZQY0_9SPHI|nr:TonB-dependent receptor [Pedobacter mongoliensis]
MMRLLSFYLFVPLLLLGAGNVRGGARSNFNGIGYLNRLHTGDKIVLRSVSWVLKGIVVDENNERLPGATVRLVGSASVATTNGDGEFIIEISNENDSLSIAFIGYKTKTVRAGSERTITVKLEPDIEGQKLSEVQVIGYGTQKKTTMVGSVASVSVKELQKFSTPSLSNSIGGKLPGVITRQASGEPGYDAAAIYIRGMVSQAGERRPLIIVDGVERELNNYWNTINVQEIESFSVLKDATATAVYGSRGANGVIMITTKRGALGKPKVTFRSETAVLSAIRITDNVDSYEYASLMNEASVNTGGAPVYSDAQLEKYRNGSDPYLYPNVNWNDVVLNRRALQTINNLGISGGSESIKYYANLAFTLQEGNYNEDGSIPYKTNAALKKYNFRSNVDISLTKNLSVDLGVSGIIQNLNLPGESAARIFERLKLITPLSMPLTNPNGSIPGNTGDLVLNPYSLATQTGYTRQFYNTLVSNLGARWNLSSVTEGLSLRGLAAFDVVDITQNIRNRTPSTFLYSKNSLGEDVYQPLVNETPLGLRNLFESYRTIYAEAAANYDRTFGKHGVSGLLLAQRREYVDVATQNSIANLPERRQGLVGRFTYNFDSKYLLELNAAYNGSENFPKGKQYGFFPSIGAGWLISNEGFWNSNVVNSLKLRGSYGRVGNDRIGGARFLFQTIVEKNGPGYDYGLGYNNGIGGIVESRIGNQDVTWELAKKSNIGLDLGLFNNRISLTADLFHERREDQLLQRVSIPVYTGYPSSTVPFGNVGISTNKGVDAGLQIRNTTKKGFYYSFLGNFTFAKNNIVENDIPSPLYPQQELRGNVIGANLGYVALGFFKDQADIDASPKQTELMSIIRPGDVKYKDQNGDGLINNADRVIIGKYGADPQIMYGFGTTLGWRGIDFTIFFTGAARRDFFFNDRNFSMWAFQHGLGTYNVNQEYYDNRWVPGADNTNAKYPAVVPGSTNNYIISSLWQRSGNYLKIKNAEIGYSLPKSITRRAAINTARLFVQGTNLAIWDKIKIIDPESDFGTGGYPTTSNLNFGLEVNF